jgi:hypothetical protein
MSVQQAILQFQGVLSLLIFLSLLLNFEKAEERSLLTDDNQEENPCPEGKMRERIYQLDYMSFWGERLAYEVIQYRVEKVVGEGVDQHGY